jgi:hypothetical protein
MSERCAAQSMRQIFGSKVPKGITFENLHSLHDLVWIEFSFIWVAVKIRDNSYKLSEPGHHIYIIEEVIMIMSSSLHKVCVQ